jgi:hypothetical protein
MTTQNHLSIFFSGNKVVFVSAVILILASVLLLSATMGDVSASLDSSTCFDRLMTTTAAGCVGGNVDPGKGTIDADIPSVVGSAIPFP